MSKFATSNSKPINCSKVIGIQFSIQSPEEIRKGSVAEITSRDTYINNKPVIGGLFDPRMGVLEPGLICPTDGLTYIDTPGYFGHIELVEPIPNPHFSIRLLIYLAIFCWHCSSRIIEIIPKSQKKIETFLSILTTKSRGAKCCNCNQTSPIISINENGLLIIKIQKRKLSFPFFLSLNATQKDFYEPEIHR
jgi:DNA-directed RNA polymerase beta' subunit